MKGDAIDGRSARARILRHVLHDLANVFTCIFAAASHRPSDRAETERHLTAIATAAELGRDLLVALRSVPEDGAETVTALERVLRSSSRLLRCVAEPRGVVVTTKIDDLLVAIPGHELQEIVINLGLNAIEAMPDGGALAITTSATEDRVRIAIRDDGVGVDPGLLDDPISTKGPSRGSGLSSVLRILQRAGGSIELTSDADGTCFVVELRRG